MPIALGFGGWAAFKDMGQHTMVMGDLALLQEEVNLVISALEKNGLEVSALHNHFFYEGAGGKGLRAPPSVPPSQSLLSFPRP